MIDYNLLAQSTKFYETCGYQRVEVPWTVTREVSDITRPPGAKEYQLVHDNNKVLVASAEQSFLYQYAKGFLPKGRFQAITPCFRFENFDSTHTKYFVKNELIVTDRISAVDLTTVIADAKLFFQQFFKEEVSVVNTGENMYDIEYKGTELGSYGIRKCDFLHWIYGTGIAEPRLSGVIKKHELSSKTYPQR